MSVEACVKTLQEILDKKFKLMNGLLKLTEEQAGIISEDSLDQLGRIIAQKQKIIEAVDKLDEEFNVYFDRLKEKLNVDSLEQVKVSDIKGADRLKESVSRILEVVRAASDIDRKNSEKANKLINGLSSSIQKIAGGKKAASAYKPSPAQLPSYFIDKKK
jgi:flagellar biosynthesis/type III secretory pathway chaperone